MNFKGSNPDDTYQQITAANRRSGLQLRGCWNDRAPDWLPAFVSGGGR